MSPRRTVEVAEPEVQAPSVIRQCRRCFRPLEGRQVYCGDACLETDDQRAAVLVEHVATRREWIAEQVIDIDQRIQQLQADRRRVVGGAEAELVETETRLAQIRASLEAARSAGEVRFALASDRPARSAAGRMA
ncbi:MAG: hypothetical protein JWO98_2249 [Frankiales bacterium]|nr:hypothetical protein [Frankiales bacterium]